MAGRSNPKFLNVEKKVVYNIRLPQRLIDKYNAYSELTGNTTTNIVINVLEDFIADKVVLNDYLDNIGGVAVKIPYSTYQKSTFINNNWNLKDYTTEEKLTDVSDISPYEPFNAELFEIRKIPNNLDIKDGDSYVANKNILKINHNAIHSGIELFVYNISDVLFDRALSTDEFDSFIKCLYCLYFETKANYDVDVYLIDYSTAVNLLSASGNEYYKNLIIAVATELKKIDDLIAEYESEFFINEYKIAKKYLYDDDDENAKYEKAVDELIEEYKPEYDSKYKSAVDEIADKYNSGNIIRFGTDIFSRIAVENAKFTVDDFDELIDEKLNKKIEKLEKENAEMKSKLNEINEINKLILGDDAELESLRKLL